MMKEAGLLDNITAIVIYQGRDCPCLCSWITTTHAGSFNNFVQNMTDPVID
jgi:hypothetical protein